MRTFRRPRGVVCPRHNCVVFVVGPVLLGLALFGCAPEPVAPIKKFELDRMVVYPLPPAKPRIEFLRAFSGSGDFVKKKKMSGFAEWLVGGAPEEAEEKIRKPDGIGAWDGKLYAVDQKQKSLAVFDLKAETFKFIRPSGPAHLEKPRSLYIDGKGNKYISDMGRSQVLVLDAQDAFMTAYGMSDPAETFMPVACVPVGDELFVVDMASHNIAVFELATGRFLRRLGSRGSKPGQFVFPYDIAAESDGTLLITDFLNTRVQHLDRSGKVLGIIGSLGRHHGNFVRPKGIDVGPDGTIYVVDAAFEAVQMFNAEGHVLMSFGAPADQPGDLVLPTSVVASADAACIEALRPYAHPDFRIDYLLLVANQFGTSKVNVYAFGAFAPGKNPIAGRARPRPTSRPAAEGIVPIEALRGEPSPVGGPTSAPARLRVIDPLEKPAPSSRPAPATHPAEGRTQAHPPSTARQAAAAASPVLGPPGSERHRPRDPYASTAHAAG